MPPKNPAACGRWKPSLRGPPASRGTGAPRKPGKGPSQPDCGRRPAPTEDSTEPECRALPLPVPAVGWCRGYSRLICLRLACRQAPRDPVGPLCHGAAWAAWEPAAAFPSATWCWPRPRLVHHGMGHACLWRPATEAPLASAECAPGLRARSVVDPPGDAASVPAGFTLSSFLLGPASPLSAKDSPSVRLLIETTALGGRTEVKNSEVAFPYLILEGLTEPRPTRKTRTSQMSSSRFPGSTQLDARGQDRDRHLPLATDRGGVWGTLTCSPRFSSGAGDGRRGPDFLGSPENC